MKKKSLSGALAPLLAEAFKAPSPDRKEPFIYSLPRQRISNLKFLLTQAGYIPLWVWGLCCLPFPALLLNACLMAKSTLWILSALTPFVAMSAVAANARSSLCHMAELEMASRFSLKSVVLARLSTMGIAHLSLLILLSPLTCRETGRTLLESGIYLLVPYLLTTFLSLLCSRKIHGSEALYACLGVAVMVSCLSIFLQKKLPVVYQEKYISCWILGLLLLPIPILWEYYKAINQTEELIWNLS